MAVYVAYALRRIADRPEPFVLKIIEKVAGLAERKADGVAGPGKGGGGVGA